MKPIAWGWGRSGWGDRDGTDRDGGDRDGAIGMEPIGMGAIGMGRSPGEWGDGPAGRDGGDRLGMKPIAWGWASRSGWGDRDGAIG